MDTQGKTGFLIDDWQVSPAEGVVNRGDDTLRLEPKAMEVLVYLASHPGEVISREELEREVWHGAVIGYDAVTNTVIKLRKALRDDARQPRYIATIPKKGYQLIAKVGEQGPAQTLAQDTTSMPAMVSPWRPRRSLYIASMAIIPIIGLLLLWPREPSESYSTKPVTTGIVSTPPSIIVLPFENLGNDPQHAWLADGITDDIITDLSRLSNILVIASNTSSRYKGKNVPVKQIGENLNVSHVLKGSVRQLGDAVRVNAQLVNARTGFNLWAQRYDRKTTEIFSVQSDVTNRIVEALAVKISSQEQQRLTKNATASLQAYDFFQEGQRLYKINTLEANQQAAELYRNAIELDPDYGRAYGAWAVALTASFHNDWTDSPVETLDRALELASKAVELDNTSPQTWWALGFVHLRRKEFDLAEKATAETIRIAPNYADGYALLGFINAFRGNAEHAISLNDKAIRLNPYYSFEVLISQGLAYYMHGDYTSAVKTLEEAQTRNEYSIPVKIWLTASYVKAGRQEDAEWTADQISILSTTSTLSEIEKSIPIENLLARKNLLDTLRQAGLPE